MNYSRLITWLGILEEVIGGGGSHTEVQPSNKCAINAMKLHVLIQDLPF